jgi:oligoendopeptidase F
LEVRYEIEPRPGKYPIAFTDIAHRDPMRAWVSASYRIGGFDNLAELLHETGHALHVSAISTRPAYADWPGSDTFTEAIADLAALEMFEPAWQQRFLGVAAPLDASLRAKYSGIVLDIAWSLFEIRVHRTPSRSPNEIWTELTRDYLNIKPHPELSWWAVRGQLVESPGYMVNYALGAILIADLRARLIELRGPFTTGDPRWYSWVRAWLYRQGREEPSREVVNRFLGRALSPEALLADLGRR